MRYLFNFRQYRGQRRPIYLNLQRRPLDLSEIRSKSLHIENKEACYITNITIDTHYEVCSFQTY